MVKPLIPMEQPIEKELTFSEKITQKLMNVYVKVLGKKKFVRSAIQHDDDKIVQLVQEGYNFPDDRQRVVGNWKLDEELNELTHVAYVNLDEKIVLIVYRGTDFQNLKDLISDIQIVLGINAIDMRVKESWDFYDKITMKYPHHQKRVTGHSLWGTICYLVTKHRNADRCVVFNPWSSPTKSFLSMMQDTFLKKARTRKITTYKIFWDAISTLSFIGNVKTFFLKTLDPVKLHTINSFPQFFENEQEEENR